MNKKKVIAIVLFLFMSLFMFTFANPANKISEKQDDKKTEETDKTINSDKNKNQLEIIDDAPTIYVDPYAIEIVEGSSYNVFKGVTIRDDHDTNLKATASIIDTTKLAFGKTYTVYYTTKDSSNNTSTATRLITVLDPNGDKDKDGFTNKEEVDKNTDFSDEKDYPETLAPVLTLKGDNPTLIELNVDSYKEEGVEVTLDSHDKITDTEKDLKIKSDLNEKLLGEYTITYSITDRYGKSASITRTVNVVDTTSPKLTLKGKSTIIIEAYKDSYKELNTEAVDLVDGTWTVEPEFIHYSVNGKYVGEVDSVDNTKLGTYKIRYSCTDKSNNVCVDANRSDHDYVLRTVKVVDTTAPKLTLNGDSSITLEAYKDSYEELNAKAVDLVDGTWTVEPEFIHYSVNGKYVGEVDSVDNTKLGTYKIRYSCTDKNNNVCVDAARSDHNYVMRTVNVVDTTAAKVVAANILVLGDKNEQKTFYATNGDTIYAYIRVSEELRELPTFNLVNNGKSYKVDKVEVSGPNAKGEYTYTIKYLIDENVDMKDGNIELSVSNIYDLAGNKTSDVTKPTNGHIVILDRTNPEISVKESSIGSIKDAIYSNVSFKLYDAVSIDKVSINGTIIDLSNNSWSDVNNVTKGTWGAKEGKNTIVLYDLAGNTTEYEFIIDTVKPVISVKESSIGSIKDAMYSNVSFKLHDTVSIDKVSINGIVKDLSNNKWSDINDVTKGVFGANEGKNIIVLYDLAGNTTEYEFIIDTVKPYMEYEGKEYLSGCDTLYVNKRFIATTKDSLSGIDKIYANGYERLKIDVNGESNYTFRLVDKAGNESIYKVVVDKTAPVIDGVVNNDVYTDKVNYTITDKNLDSIVIDGITYTSDDYIKELDTKGEHTIVATDKAGNTTIVNFVIKETLTIEDIGNITFDSLEVTYDGAFHRVDVKNLSKDFIVSYGRTNGKRDAGNYNVVATITSKDNTYYTGSVKLTTSMIINPKEVNVTWSNLDLVYNGNEQVPTATVDTGIIANLGSGNSTKDIIELEITGAKKEVGEGYTATASIKSVTTNKANYVLKNTETKFNIKADENNNNIDDEKENHYNITFESSNHGTLSGKLEYKNILTDLTFEKAGIVVPTTVADTYYEFKNWTPEIVNKVTKTVIYKAIFGPIHDENNNDIADEEETFNLNITYTYSRGGEVFTPHQENVVYNTEYSVVSPVKEYYNASIKIVDGLMPNNDLNVEVIYSPINDKNDNKIADEEENHYNITFESSKHGTLSGKLEYKNVLTDLTFKKAGIVVPTTVADTYYEFKNWTPEIVNKVTKTVTYKANFGPIHDENNNDIADEEELYLLTINYNYLNGNKAYDSYSGKVLYNTTYTIESPIINYYTASITTVTGTMPMDKVIINVTYRPINDENHNNIADEEEVHSSIMYDKNTADEVSNMPTDENNILIGLSKDLSNIIPTRKDYVFASWTTKDVEVVNGKFTMPGKNVTFKANWKDDKNNNGIDDSIETKYSITYTTDYSDVTGMPSSVEGLLSGIEHSITSAVPTKLGYTFIGWTTEDVEVVNGKFTMPEKNITFKANFQASKDTIYKVITKVERLNGTYTNDVEVIKGITDQVITLNPTNKDGFTVSNNSVLTGTVTANQKLELTIIYTRNTYKVNYVSNGNIIDTKSYKYEQEVNYRPANPTRVNYTFNGWDTTITKMPARDVTVTATWIANQIGIKVVEKPNVQFQFKKGTTPNFASLINVYEVYADGTTKETLNYTTDVNTSTVTNNDRTLTITENGFTDRSIKYSVINEEAFQTKFEVKFNATNSYKQTNDNDCKKDCDSDDKTNTVNTEYNFLEIVEHYDENIDLESALVTYTNDTRESINLTDSIRWTHKANSAKYNPVYIGTTSRTKEIKYTETECGYKWIEDDSFLGGHIENVCKDVEKTRTVNGDIINSNYVIDTIAITYSRTGFGNYTITFKYNSVTKIFTAIDEVKNN